MSIKTSLARFSAALAALTAKDRQVSAPLGKTVSSNDKLIVLVVIRATVALTIQVHGNDAVRHSYHVGSSAALASDDYPHRQDNCRVAYHDQ